MSRPPKGHPTAHKEPAPASSAEAHLPLVERVVRQVARRLPAHLSLDDLVGAGVVGLLEAQRRFDPDKGRDFKSFAERRIHGAVIDELRRSDMMARDARQECKRIEAAIARLSDRLHRPPREEEVAQEIGIQHLAYVEKLEKLAPVRLKSFDEDEHSRRAARAQHLQGGSDTSPFEATLAKENVEALARAVDRLSLRQQQVIHLYYREELTMRQIGEVLEVTESRVCQIMSQATLSLRASMRKEAAIGTRAARDRAVGREAGQHG